jgi:protein gp37
MNLGDSCWWDDSFNWLDGCPGCGLRGKNCWAKKRVATLLAHLYPERYGGLTKTLPNGRVEWTRKTGVLRPGHADWTSPLDYRNEHPLLGAGMPSLLALNLMGDTFAPGHKRDDIDRGLMTVAASRHIGLQVTGFPKWMVAYFLALETRLSPEALRRWQAHIWLGISAAYQKEFKRNWSYLRQLAERGWVTFVSLAPLLEAIVLPDDFLRLVYWVIVSGECDTKHEFCRRMDPAWALAIKEQLLDAKVPLFMKRMSFDEHIPLGLLGRCLPDVQPDFSVRRPRC